MKSAPLVNAASSSNRKSPNRKSQIAKSQIIPLSFRRAPTLRNLFLLVTFATSVAAQNTSYKQDPSWHAPDKAATRKNPLSEYKNAAAGGAKLFQRHCAECHSPTGAGLKKAANFTIPEVQSQTDGTLFWKITNGNPERGMPPFSKFPELQRWQLVLHLRTLKASQ